jgi:hypothetical protein
VAALGAGLGVTATPSIAVQQPAGTDLTDGSGVADFGPVVLGGSQTLSFTIVNIGTTSVTDLAINLTGAGASQFQAGAPAATILAPGDSTTFELTFAPVSGGKGLAGLQISSQNPALTVYNLTVTGIGASFAQAAGTFIGTALSDGNLSVTAAPNGRFTSRLILHGVRQSFSGAFDSTESFVGTVGQAGIAVSLHLTVNAAGGSPGSYAVAGTVAGAPVTAWHTAYAAGSSAKEAGRYTVLLAPSATEPTLPAGSGYAALVIGRNGVATLAGRLADGTAFSSSGPLVSGNTAGVNQLIVYADSAGFRLAGPLAFETLATSDCDGALQWNRLPSRSAYYGAGFSTSLAVAGARYTAPSRGVAALPLNGTGLYTVNLGTSTGSVAITETVMLTNSNRFIDQGSDYSAKLAIALSSSTGLFTGSFVDAGSRKRIGFTGAIYQNAASPSGGGYFLAPVVAGIGLGGSIGFAPP